MVRRDGIRMSNQANRLVRNSLFSSSSYFVIVLIALVTTPYIVAKLGMANYGIYILLTSLVGYYSLLDLGFNQGVTKYVAEFREKKQPEAVNRSINASLFVQLGLGLIASVLLMLFADPIVRVLNVDPVHAAEARTGIYICSVGFFFTMISGTFNAVLAGIQRYDLTGKTDSAVNLLLNLMIVLLLFLGSGLKELVAATVISAIISTGVYVVLVRRLVPEWELSLRFDKVYFQLIFNFSSFMFIAKISNVFSTYVVRFIISYFLGPAAVTLFVIPSKLLSAFGGLLSSAASVIFPYTSQLNVSERDKINEMFIKASRIFAALSIPVLLFIMVYSYQILSLWMGADFAEQSYLVFSIITFSGLVAAQTTVPNLIISGLGYSRLIGFFGILAVVCYTIFLPLLTKGFGIVGAATGMLLTTLINVIFVFKLITKKMDISFFPFLKTTFGFHLAPVIFSLIFSILIHTFGLEGSIVVFCAGFLAVGLYFWLMIKNNMLPLELIFKRKSAVN
jgi:O-antigen/teichoic acid export membrane protein